MEVSSAPRLERQVGKKVWLRQRLKGRGYRVRVRGMTLPSGA